MCKFNNEAQDIETMARAFKQVPGFETMMWRCAEHLYEAQAAARKLREYKASNQPREGRVYTRLVTTDARRSEAFRSDLDMIEIILEAVDLFYDHTGLLFEVEQLKNRYAEQLAAIRF